MTEWLSNGITIAGSSIGSDGVSSILLSQPADVFVNKNNILYVLDSGNYRVQRFDLNSTIGITVINSSYGSMLNQFYSSKNII